MSLSKEATSKLFSVKYINCKRRYGMWKRILISSGLLACLSCPQFTSDAYTVLMHQTDVNMNLTYPLVYLYNEAAQTKVNTEIAIYVDKMRDLYYKEKMYTVNLNYETTYEDDDYISLIITSGWYNGQSAHGYYTSQGLVFDKHTGNLIPATNYVHLKDDEQLYKLVMEGMLPVFSSREHQLQCNEFQILDKKIPIRNNNYVLLGEGKIAMLYQPYEISYYANGVTRIVFTSEKIEYINRLNS